MRGMTWFLRMSSGEECWGLRGMRFSFAFVIELFLAFGGLTLDIFHIKVMNRSPIIIEAENGKFVVSLLISSPNQCAFIIVQSTACTVFRFGKINRDSP